MQSMPYVLVTRNPNVKTIADFTENDKIALPAVKLTGHAIALEMASAKVWVVGGSWEGAAQRIAAFHSPDDRLARVGFVCRFDFFRRERRRHRDRAAEIIRVGRSETGDLAARLSPLQRAVRIG